MTGPVPAVDAERDIEPTTRMLSGIRFMRALVTEQGGMVGIVTLRDIAIRAAGKAV